MMIRVVCGGKKCSASGRVDVPDSSFPHIDRRALASGAMTGKGWVYRNGQMGKSVITLLCPRHREPSMTISADFVPEEVLPGNDLWLTEEGPEAKIGGQ